VGFEVGGRILELLSYRERNVRRHLEAVDILKYIHSVAWPYMFGKKADDLQQANAADDEYMISDNDLLVGKFISVPKSYSSFVPGSLVAGIVRGMLEAAGFPARSVKRQCVRGSTCECCHLASFFLPRRHPTPPAWQWVWSA